MTDIFRSLSPEDMISEEQRLVLDTFEDYCKRNIEKYREKWSKDGIFPRSMLKEIMHIFQDSFITSDQDMRLDETTIGFISELMGRYKVPIPVFLTLHFSKLLPHIASEVIRNDFLTRLKNGDLLLCGAFTEPTSGSDSAAISTNGRWENGGFVINGEKAFISNPGMADACIFSAKTEEGNNKVKKHDNITLFIAESGAEGLNSYETSNMASEFKGDFGGITLENLFLSEGNIVGELNQGFRLLMGILNTQRVHVSLYSLGIAEKSVEDAIEYAKIRNAFGEPISRKQAVSFRLAEDWTRIEASRLLAFKALELEKKKLDSNAYCSAVKWYACESAFQAVSDSLQTLGASGYVKSSSLEQNFRISRGFLIGDGTPDIQKLIIARNLFK